MLQTSTVRIAFHQLVQKDEPSKGTVLHADVPHDDVLGADVRAQLVSRAELDGCTPYLYVESAQTEVDAALTMDEIREAEAGCVVPGVVPRRELVALPMNVSTAELLRLTGGCDAAGVVTVYYTVENQYGARHGRRWGGGGRRRRIKLFPSQPSNTGIMRNNNNGRDGGGGGAADTDCCDACCIMCCCPCLDMQATDTAAPPPPRANNGQTVQMQFQRQPQQPQYNSGPHHGSGQPPPRQPGNGQPPPPHGYAQPPPQQGYGQPPPQYNYQSQHLGSPVVGVPVEPYSQPQPYTRAVTPPL